MKEELTIEEKWDRAGLSNNFIFYKVMRNNPDICKELLEILLEFEIDHIEMSQEESVFIDPDSKGIRMDVYLKNESQSFNIEIQATDTGDLNKRARYYQGVMDVDNLKSGELYSKLKDSYVIFICLNDIFGEGLPLYIFENFCQQNKNLKLDDRTYKYFFAACNCDKLLNERQRTFFDLLVSKKSSDSFTERLSQLITNAKHNTQWRKQFMDYEREMAYARAAGRNEGLAKGRDEKSIETAKQLLAMNLLSAEQISQATGLSIEKIKELK